MQYRNVNGDLVEPVKEFDLLDEDRPRDGGFVSIGEVARPLMARLRHHLKAGELSPHSSVSGSSKTDDALGGATSRRTKG